MKRIVVELSGDAARPRLRNRRRHDHDREARPSARQRPIVIKDDETGTVIVLSRLVQGVASVLQGRMSGWGQVPVITFRFFRIELC
jgi:hypothetical protein